MNLNQITLPSADLARGCEFYRALGLRQIVDALPRYARFECPDGEATLSLHLAPRPVLAGRGPVVYFECLDLDATYARLVASGIPFDSPPLDQPWLWREARLHDPDRNALCLFQAGSNRRFPPWRVR